jgi:two-component system sensor histidine kinase MprB
VTLRWRIALGLSVIAAAICVLAATAAYESTSTRLASEVDSSLLSHARDAHDHGGGPNHPPPGGSGEAFDGGCPPGAFEQTSAAQIVNTQTRAITECRPGTVRLPVSAADLHAGQPSLRTVSVDGSDYRMVTTSFGDGTVLQLARSLSENHAVMSSLRVRLAGVSVLGIAAAAVLGWLFARRIVKPVERLRATAEHIARTQDLDAVVTTSGTDEVASLSNSFSMMVGALASSRRQQQQLVADASHELRTPLTALRTNAELLEREDMLSVDQRRQVAQGIQVEVTELTALVSELVDLARDPSSDAEPVERVDLGELTHRVVERAAHRTSRRIDLSADASGVVDVRPRMLERAISNLIDNAVKYGTGEIEVTVVGTRVEVCDHGAGINDVDLPHVFDRFYRADNARTASGSGLGLAIVQQIVTLHGGTVWARNVPDGGAGVGFELPSAQVAHT